MPQPTPASRTVHVVVSDQRNRFVTGLSPENFDVTEDGALPPITTFSDANSLISLAIVAQSIPAEVTALRRSGDEIIQAQSVSDALRALAASEELPQALIFTSGTIIGEISSGNPGAEIRPAESEKISHQSDEFVFVWVFAL